jgi:Zn finger protein HypA/HybF involved in hydrogenase expression
MNDEELKGIGVVGYSITCLKCYTTWEVALDTNKDCPKCKQDTAVAQQMVRSNDA